MHEKKTLVTLDGKAYAYHGSISHGMALSTDPVFDGGVLMGYMLEVEDSNGSEWHTLPLEVMNDDHDLYRFINGVIESRVQFEATRKAAQQRVINAAKNNFKSRSAGDGLAR